MAGAGIADGDELVVDRSLTPVDGNVVVAIIDDELTIKRLWLEHGRVTLAAENPDYSDVVGTGAFRADHLESRHPLPPSRLTRRSMMLQPRSLRPSLMKCRQPWRPPVEFSQDSR